MPHRPRRAYDHRIKEQIIRAGNPDLLPAFGIPRSTAMSWIRRGHREVVSLDPHDDGKPALRKRVAKLERRIAILTAVLRLPLAPPPAPRFQLQISPRSRPPGKVFAHPGTWGKLVRERGWLRPRLRLYPAKPKIGLRTHAPNEAWHIDVTIIKLLDGTKAYVHAVIDNFSRRILAWTCAGRLDPMNTHDVLTRAAAHLVASTNVFMDSGVENLNGDVDPLFERGALRRVIAQIDVTFSNSLIEAWWRSLKHRWLFLHPLDNLATVRRLVEFYVTEHNERIPPGAFEGETPDEMYFGRGGQVPNDLALRRREARQQRLARNRQVACAACPRGLPLPSEDAAV